MPKHKPKLTLVIDQGSHASRIALFSETGEMKYLKSSSISTSNPKSSFYEQNANEILESIETLINGLPSELIHDIKNAGLCTQRSTVVAWNRSSGCTLSPAISWRDTRAQPLINKLTPSAAEIRKVSGLPLSAHYSAGKINWLLQNNDAVKQTNTNELCISPLVSFLLFHLLKNKSVVIDHSNAQRCQLFDIQKLNWSDDLLQLFKIDKKILPTCAPVTHYYGELKDSGIPLTAVCGDQNGALFAYPPLQKNSALINIGTGAFILSNTKESNSSDSKLLHTLSSSNNSNATFVTEGTVNGAGAALSWAQKNDPCEDIYTQLPIWLKQIKSPPVFINSIASLGSPWWCDAGNPDFLPKDSSGNNAPYNQGERYSAIIESIIFLIFKNLQHLASPPDTLFVSGGLSQLDALCQKLADISAAKVLRFTDSEATARGCAWLANQALENNNLKWKTLEISKQFVSRNGTKKQKEMNDRYQQFVGELNKRCGND